jgi:tRNA/rRNA methyltransferase
MTYTPTIILVSPQMGENIGAGARAMKNFGATDLRIVTPRDGWPNPKAEAMAVGAVDIIHNAKVYKSLGEAVADLEYLYATTAQSRAMNKKCVSLKNLLAQDVGARRVGVMFGRESSGLTNEEISYANEIITIDTSEFSSLNIAQAVGLVCYELFKMPLDKANTTNSIELCTKGELKYFFDHLFTELDKTKLFRDEDRSVYMRQNIMNIFNRVDKLSHTEVQALRGVVAALASNGLQEN